MIGLCKDVQLRITFTGTGDQEIRQIFSLLNLEICSGFLRDSEAPRKQIFCEIIVFLSRGGRLDGWYI